MTQAGLVSTVLFEPSVQPDGRTFEFLFALGIGGRVFAKNTEAMRRLISATSQAMGQSLEERVHLFSDWMEVFEQVSSADLIAVSRGDLLSGFADRVGVPFLPIPPMPKDWVLRKQSVVRAKRIAVVGPESSGKTTLVEALANDLGAMVVPEYVRFLLIHREASRCLKEDMPWIGRAQAALEDAICAGEKDLVICDTEPRHAVVWSDVLFGEVDPWLTEWTQLRSYTGHLLLRPDLPWVADSMRCLPQGGETIFTKIKSLLDQSQCRYAQIEGEGELRHRVASQAIEKLMS